MTITTPTIITVLDAKNHVVSRTVVDYEETDETTSNIKTLCEMNQWRIKVEVPPTAEETDETTSNIKTLCEMNQWRIKVEVPPTAKVFQQTLQNCDLKAVLGTQGCVPSIQFGSK